MIYLLKFFILNPYFKTFTSVSLEYDIQAEVDSLQNWISVGPVTLRIDVKISQMIPSEEVACISIQTNIAYANVFDPTNR